MAKHRKVMKDEFMEEKKCLEQTENEVAIVSQEIKDTLEMLSKETQSKETF